MTSEARKRYNREYREKNRDKVKQWQLNAMRAKALADLESVRKLDTNIFIFKAHNEREYIVGGWKR